MQTAWPVAITPSGNASVATLAWRRGERLFVTVVVKGTFALVLNEPMVPVAPEAIFVTEQEGPPGFALRAADDLAPYLGETDVTVLGHAIAAPTPGLRSLPVRLGVLRERTVLLDKKVAVEVPPGHAGTSGSAPYRVPIAQMGPLSRSWPVRSRLLGSASAQRLQGVFLEIPDPFDWRYFQAAPADQRTPPLRGGEWLVLEGMHPTHPRFMSQLPPLCGVARVLGRQPTPGTWRALDLLLDAVWIDADRRRCSLTWRGHFPLSGEHELGSLTILAGLEPIKAQAAAPASPGAQTPVVQTPIQAPSTARIPAQQAPPEDPLAGTLMLEDGDVQVEGQDPLLGTLGLTEETAAEIAARPATPFHAAKPPPAAGATPSTAVFNPADDPLLGTLGLREETAAELAARPVLPFHEGDRVSISAMESDPLLNTLSAPEHDPLGGTLGLTEETAAEIAARPVVPFLGYGASPPAALSYLRNDDALGTSIFEAPRPAPMVPPPMDLRPEEGDMPSALGAQFLLAMASVEKQRRAPPALRGGLRWMTWGRHALHWHHRFTTEARRDGVFTESWGSQNCRGSSEQILRTQKFRDPLCPL